MKQVKTKAGKDIYIHHVPFSMGYVVVSETVEEKNLHKLELSEIDMDSNELRTYLLGVVRIKYPDIDKEM